MRILLVSQYFYPEFFIINDLVKCLISQGHTIEILTGKPNYPDGVIFPGYTATGCMSEYFDKDVLIHRVPIWPRGRGEAKRLILNYASFVLSGLFYFHRLVKKKKFDVIFVFAMVPITMAIPAIYLKKRFKIHLAVWIQDLWPNTLKVTGYVKNKFLLKGVGLLVRCIYTYSDTLLVQSKAFYQHVMQYACEDKIIYYPNSYLPARTSDMRDQVPDKLLFEFDNNNCIIFAGNIGTAQSVNTILQAATLLSHITNLKFILFGHGSMYSWTEQQIVEKGIHNIILAGNFPSSIMPTIFSMSMGLLVTLKRDEVLSYTIPSKIQAYLSAGRPIIAGLDGEGARIIEEAQAGLVSPAEDAVGLAKNIEDLYNMSISEREEFGRAGYQYFLENFEMMSQSKRLIDILDERINKKSCV